MAAKAGGNVKAPSMADIWFPFYTGSYAKHTKGLSQAEHGAYICLLIYYYSKRQPIPHHRRYAIASAFASEEQAAVDSVLSEFFHQEGTSWVQDRVEQELKKSGELSKKRAEAAEKRWQKGEAKASASDMQLHIQPQPPIQIKDLNSGLGGQGGSFKPSVRSKWNVLDHLSRVIRFECEDKVKKYGWAFDAAVGKYNDWVKDNPPRNPEMGFPAWIENFCGKNRL